MAKAQIETIINERGDALNIEKFDKKLKELPMRVKIDLQGFIDMDKLMEEIAKKEKQRNRNLSSYHNDIYY
jgi:hypothetical protein